MGNAEEQAGMRLDDWAIGLVIKAADLSRSWEQQYKSPSPSTIVAAAGHMPGLLRPCV